jgi:AcrR family transcriptional regulator
MDRAVDSVKTPGTKSPPDARWSRTRERLLEGGRKAFAQRGVEATSVLDIVREAGVSQPSFYNHFDSKEKLAEEITADYFRRDKKAKQAIFDTIDDPAEAIAINIAHTLAVVVDDPVIAWAIVRSESLRQLVISSDSDPLARIITSGMGEKRFLPGNPRIIALTIRGGAFAVMQDMLKGSAAESACEDYQELVLRMLGLDTDDCVAVVSRVRQRL